METIKRKCEVITVKAKVTTVLGYDPENKKWYYNPYGIGAGEQSYILLITSDEEIKQGDWFTDGKEAIKKALSIEEGYIHSVGTYKSNECKKIIASSGAYFQVPSPSLSFIKKYCKANGYITEVMVEYNKVIWNNRLNQEQLYSGYETEGDEINWEERITPKVNSNGEISISKVKNVWTTEEVEQMMLKYFKKGINPLTSIDIRKLLYDNNSK